MTEPCACGWIPSPDERTCAKCGASVTGRELVDNATPLERTKAALATVRAAVAEIPASDAPGLSAAVYDLDQALAYAWDELQRAIEMEGRG